MRDNFRWERDTDNYRRYVSETKDNNTGKFKVVYIPKNVGGDMPKIIEGMIVSDSEHGLQCCSRDNDFDGNCSVHSAPGVLRANFREMENRVIAQSLCPRPFQYHGTETGRFASRAPQYASWEGHNELEARVTKLEKRQGILFQAVEKIIKLIGWKPSRKKKISIDIETSFIPDVIVFAKEDGSTEIIDYKKR